MRLEVPSGSQVIRPIGGATPYMETEEYCKRYVVGGSKFTYYADCGRLWDANADGAYSRWPWDSTVPDVAKLAYGNATEIIWPEMPFAPKPCLTHPSLWNTIPAGTEPPKQFSKGYESYLEISFDSGTNWQYLGGYQVNPKRLAVRLTEANLAAILLTDGDPDDDNLFERLATAPGAIRLRLTCCIVSPNRAVEEAAPRAAAGTLWPQSGVFDRAKLQQVKTRGDSSRFAATSIPADYALSDNKLNAAATLIQDAHADRLIEAALPIEWPDTPIRLTDCITQIEGIGYDLSTNIGTAIRYPRVIGITYNVTPADYSATLQLHTDRYAGVV